LQFFKQRSTIIFSIFDKKKLEMKLPTLLILFCLFFSSVFIYSQNNNKPGAKDSTSVVVGLNKSNQSIFKSDTLSNQEVSPLDIGAGRGLFITTPDNKMQMRILGSVRMYTWYDSKMLNSPNNFNTYNIPVGPNSQVVPNFFFSVSQSRFGFEVTRITGIGKIFVRLEMDFLGANNSLRIRHAYGQYKNWLFGQTWTLFMDVESRPLTVDRNGPTGTVNLRTPQIRYTNTFGKKFIYDFGLEYSQPQYTIPDSVAVSSIMAFPSITARLRYDNEWAKLQFSTILSRLIFQYPNQDNSHFPGYGFLFSGKFIPRNHKKDQITTMGTYVNALSRFITTFRNAGLDAIYDPYTEKFASISALGSYLAYTRQLPKKIDATLSIGYAFVFNKSYQEETAFRESFNIGFDGFWQLYAGTRLGVGYIYGWRYNKNFDHSSAGRLAVLFLYDF
jgi:hypothetical protein